MVTFRIIETPVTGKYAGNIRTQVFAEGALLGEGTASSRSLALAFALSTVRRERRFRRGQCTFAQAFR